MEKKEKNRNTYSELPEGEEPFSTKFVKKESQKGKENRDIVKKRIYRKSNYAKERSNPERFSGEGINFKAKIIGVEDVFDARGNRMCQGALRKLKENVKLMGAHKQRIILNISLNGIIIKDEKSGEILHHHPIHKISCISQDTKDNRAFGFVYGCPQTGHRFFAIKTEKAASQVVVTLRDLFLVALEIKKKEIEKASDTLKENDEHVQNVEENAVDSSSNGNAAVNNFFTATFESSPRLNHDLLYSNTVLLPEEKALQKSESSGLEPPLESLLDLQSEVDVLQKGISQMDQSIAHTVSQSFGLSFSEDEVSESSATSVPSSFQFKLDKLSSLYHETMSISSRSSSTSDFNIYASESKPEENETPKKEPSVNLGSITSEGCSSGVSSLSVGGNSSVSETSQSSSTAASTVEDRYAVFQDIESLPSIFDNPVIVKMPEEKIIEASYELQNVSHVSDEVKEQSEIKSSTPVPFAELDPLGNQPYVDKKDFFQDIKNPPKKVLKDLVGANNAFSGLENNAFSNSSECLTFGDLNNGDSKDISKPEEVPYFAIPPTLPSKKTVVETLFSTDPDLFQENGFLDSTSCESKNPFNPFLDENYPDIPPPNSPPPPPPPPRLPIKTLEYSPCVSLPPPRPPSRVSCVPIPPLPKRKVPLSSTQRTWFSFDQDAVSPISSFSSEKQQDAVAIAPPLPSPVRKLPLPRYESFSTRSSSASNSPATVRRLHDKNSHLENFPSVIKEISDSPFMENGVLDSMKDSKLNIVDGSLNRPLSRHSSIGAEGDAFCGAAFNPFLQSGEPVRYSENKEQCHSPPLPPKPESLSQPKLSHVKKTSVAPSESSYSSSSVSVFTESSNGTHSLSSALSSSDDNKFGSSLEALLSNSTNSQSVVFSKLSQETVHVESSNGVTEVPNLSPDSIFRRKSDPFADDFFLTVHMKSGDDKLDSNKSSETVDIPSDSMKAST